MIGGGTKDNKQHFLALAQKFGSTGTLRKPVDPAALLKLALQASSRAA